jgi:hypothetical protein
LSLLSRRALAEHGERDSRIFAILRAQIAKLAIAVPQTATQIQLAGLRTMLRKTVRANLQQEVTA